MLHELYTTVYGTILKEPFFSFEDLKEVAKYIVNVSLN